MIEASSSVLDVARRAEEAPGSCHFRSRLTSTTVCHVQVLRVGAWSVRKLPENPDIPLAWQQVCVQWFCIACARLCREHSPKRLARQCQVYLNEDEGRVEARGQEVVWQLGGGLA